MSHTSVSGHTQVCHVTHKCVMSHICVYRAVCVYKTVCVERLSNLCRDPSSPTTSRSQSLALCLFPPGSRTQSLALALPFPLNLSLSIYSFSQICIQQTDYQIFVGTHLDEHLNPSLLPYHTRICIDPAYI